MGQLADSAAGQLHAVRSVGSAVEQSRTVRLAGSMAEAASTVEAVPTAEGAMAADVGKLRR